MVTRTKLAIFLAALVLVASYTARSMLAALALAAVILVPGSLLVAVYCWWWREAK